MNQSPLHDLHARLGARFVDFEGWEMPVHYGSVIAEHRAVRERAGFFDVTHLGRFRLSGGGARDALDRLLCNDLDRIAPGQTQYTLMLNEQGGIVDDLIVWWWDDGDFWVMPNSANHETVMTAFASQTGCRVSNLQIATVMIAVQGPDAPGVLGEIVGVAPSRFHTVATDWRGHVIHMAGTGYTGEPGGELCTTGEGAVELIEAFVDAGVTACGLGARDTLRLEAGLPLWGADMDVTTSPLEAGLGFAVSGEREFVGSLALQEQKAHGVERRLAGFVMTQRGVPRHGHRIRGEGTNGVVTSGNISPVLETGIGLAYLTPPLSVGEEIEVGIRQRWVPGRVVKPPFHKL